MNLEAKQHKELDKSVAWSVFWISIVSVSVRLEGIAGEAPFLGLRISFFFYQKLSSRTAAD